MGSWTRYDPNQGKGGYGGKMTGYGKKYNSEYRSPMYRSIYNQLHHYKRTQSMAGEVNSAAERIFLFRISPGTAAAPSGLTPLVGLPSWSEFEALYSFYRINRAKITIHPFRNVSDADDTGTVVTVLDHNLTAPPALIANLYQYGTLRFHSSFEDSSRVYTPSCLAPAYITSTTYGTSPRFKQWISCISTGGSIVTHQGLLLGWLSENLNSQHLRFLFTVYMSFQEYK